MASKWSRDAIERLIDSYKCEMCLYDINSPHYHNKYLRTEALKRVAVAVNEVRPNTTEKECAAKFHMLRSQFNAENNRVKTTLTSGTGTDYVHEPALWYFQNMKFLEPFVKRRKSRSSMDMSDSATGQININSSEEELMIIIEDDSNLKPGPSTPTTLLANEPWVTQDSVVEVTTPLPSPTTTLKPQSGKRRSLPGPSTSGTFLANEQLVTYDSVAEMTTPLPSPTHIVKPLAGKKRSIPGPDEGTVAAIIALTEAVKQPITVSPPEPTTRNVPDDIHHFTNFLGSLIIDISNEEIKLKLMQDLTNCTFAALAEDKKNKKLI